MMVAMNPLLSVMAPKALDKIKPTLPDNMGNTAMTPQASPYAMAMQKQAPNPMMNLFGAALKGYQQGAFPEAAAAREERDKSAGIEKGKQMLALMQAQRAIPEAQRAQWWQQNAPAIGDILGKDITGDAPNPQQFTDQILDGHISTLSAKLGIAPEKPAGPDYQFIQGPDGAIARGDRTSGDLQVMQSGAPKADTTNWQEYTDASGQLWQVNPQTGETRRVDVPRARVPDGGASGDTYRPATDAELQQWGIPPGTAVKINNRTGEPQVISGARPASEYTPAQQNKFIQQAQVLDSVEGALNQYTDLIKQYGPTVWTTGLNGDNPVAKQLDAARTAILIQAKELFNLGVLNGPDLEIISGAVPEVTGFGAWGKSTESAIAQLSVLQDYISRGRNQIPEDFLRKSRPNPAGVQAPASPSRQSWMDKLASGFSPPAAPQPVSNLTPDEEEELQRLREELGQ